MQGLGRTVGILLGLVLLLAGILIVVGLLDFLLIVLLRITGALFIVSGVLLLAWAFLGQRRRY